MICVGFRKAKAGLRWPQSFRKGKGREQRQMQNSHCRWSDEIRNQPKKNLFRSQGCQSRTRISGSFKAGLVKRGDGAGLEHHLLTSQCVHWMFWWWVSVPPQPVSGVASFLVSGEAVTVGVFNKLMGLVFLIWVWSTHASLGLWFNLLSLQVIVVINIIYLSICACGCAGQMVVVLWCK